MNGLTRFFLVFLRLAIGWHFLFEGLDKIYLVDVVGPTVTTRPWTSRAYLREATGPAGDYFRSLAGDPDAEALAILTVQPLQADQDPAKTPPRQRISPALDAAWNEYLQRFIDFYDVNSYPGQTKLAKAKMDQAKDQAVRWLLGQSGEREVEKTFGARASFKTKERPDQRVQEYRDKLDEVRQIMTQKLPLFGKDVERARLNMLKADVSRLRTELLADLEKPMREALESVLNDEQKEKGPMTVVTAGDWRHWREWNRLEWIDGLTRFGLTAVGICLLLGLFTRLACLGGAAFLLLFAAAQPALPWLPVNPQAEGHYLFITKNVIEMLALLALATTPSGRWAGLDGLVYVFMPGRRRHRQRAVQPADDPALAATP